MREVIEAARKIGGYVPNDESDQSYFTDHDNLVEALARFTQAEAERKK